MSAKGGSTAKKLLRWALPCIIGLIIAFFSARARGLNGDITPALAARYWSDGCFVSAVLIGGIGAMTWISTTGVMDIFGYGFSSLVTLFTSLRKPRDQMTFLDYKTYREEKRKPARTEWLLIGLGFLAASVALLAIYHRLAG